MSSLWLGQAGRGANGWACRLLLGAGLAIGGCSPSSLNRAALTGDLPDLQRQIKAAQAEGELAEKAPLRRLARNIARRELRAAQGDAAVERVRELRPCLAELTHDFEERSEAEDAGGAAAALALLEAGRLDAEEAFEAYGGAVEPAWRAVGARAAVGAEHAQLRRARVTDGDLGVRRAALHAALSDPLPADLQIALEAARLDPDPLARSIAVRVVGAIGTAEAVASLRDVWSTADVETRQGIVDAWATDASLRNGGQSHLLWVLETQRGLPQVVAAARLAASPGPAQAQALAVLERTIASGAVDEQRLAVLLAPDGQPALLKAMQKLSGSEDAQAAVLAAAALARDAGYRRVAQQRLLTLARSEQLWVARQARAALVVLGEQSIYKALSAELDSKRAEQRRQAAIDLLRLGRYSLAAGALGDASATVRTQVACEVLVRL